MYEINAGDSLHCELRRDPEALIVSNYFDVT